MSPAMVEPHRTPADASSDSELKPHRSQHKGQIFTSQSPSPLAPPFILSMDPPDLNPPPIARHPKPSPAHGLSKPRFMKTRKHQASPRARAPDGRAAPGFNPFGAGDDGGLQVLRGRLNSSVPLAGSRASEAPNPQSAGIVSGAASQSNSRIGKSGAAGFGKIREGSGNASVSNSAGLSSLESSAGLNSGSFGHVFAGGEISEGSGNASGSKSAGLSSLESSSGLDSCSFGSVRTESADFVSNSRRDVGGNAAGGVPSSTMGRNPSSEADAFVFWSAAKGSGNLSRNASLGSDEGFCSGLPDEMRKMNLQTFGSEDVLHQKKQSDWRSNTGKDGSFVSGGGGNSPSEGCGGIDTAGVFEFGSCAKNSYSLSREPSSGTNEDSFSHLPEEMMKLKLQSGKDDNMEKAKRSGQGSKENVSFIFGGDKNVPPDNSRNPDKNAFVFGRGLDNSSSSSQNLPSGFDKGSCYQLPEEIGKLKLEATGKENGVVFGRGLENSSSSSQNLPTGKGSCYQLPEEIGKLKLEATGKEDGVERTKKVNHKPKVFESNISHSGYDSNVPRTENLNSDAGTFFFGSGLRNNLNLNANSPLGSDEGSLSRLPDELGKLNLQSTSNEECFQKVKHVGAKNNTSTFGGIATKKLAEEMKELNIGPERTHDQTKDGSADLAADDFVFESGLKTNSVSGQTLNSSFSTLNKSPASDIPDDAGNINGQGSRGCLDSKNTDSSFGHKVDLGFGFVFGTGKKTSNPFTGRVGAALPSDIENRETRNEQKPVGSTGLIFQQGSMAANAEIPFKYTFQKGIHDNSSTTGAIPQEKIHGHSRPDSVTISSSYPSLGSTNSQTVGADFIFSGLQEKIETPHVGIGAENQGTFYFSKENLFASSHRSGTKTRRRRGKSRQPAPMAKQSISRGTVGQEIPDHESPGDYSPMDYSPYREDLVADQCSAEPSISSEEHLSSYCASTDSHISASVDVIEEGLVTAAQRMDINNDELENKGLDEYCSHNSGSSFVDKRNSGPGNDKETPQGENIGFGIGSKIAVMEGETGVFSLKFRRQASDSGKMFTSSCSLEDQSARKFAFAASPSASVPRRNYRRKNKINVGQESSDFMPSTKVPLASSSLDFTPIASNAFHSDPPQGPSGIPFVSKNENENRAAESKRSEANREPKGTPAVSIAGHEACEKWRLRGNQAYASGNLSKAEDYYTRGLNSISSGATCKISLRALMLCYSNRAATRMSLRRMREAVSDCKVAISIDPNFLRAQVRAANCYLALGETADALLYFQKCLNSKNGANCDQKIIVEASEGLDNAQKVADCMVQSEELLLKKTMNDATKALQLLSEALLISPFSERLLELKMEALVKLRSYEDAIQLCEQTLDAAEKNSVITYDVDQLKDVHSSGSSLEKLWRWRIISKSNFYLGKLEEALELLQKHEKVKPIVDKFGNRLQESSTSLSATICELLRLKAAGNEAFQAGRHLDAVEHYTSALACSTESRPFAAICFCNRAAAYQALGQITDAIADCNLAIALDGSYPKAISRRATLHEIIRDYEQAANDINRLISLLQKQVEDTDNMSGAPSRSTVNGTSLKQASLRLLAVEEEARKETLLDMYKILGIEPSSSAADVKKAYRKAALRHHPDKAGYSLTKSENVDDGLWREVAAEVHIGADRLFKMIGEAYTMLSDPNKRLQYDAEEEMRIQRKSYSGSSTPKAHSDSYSSQYDRSTSRRQWRPYGSSNQRWSEYPHENSRSYK